MNAQSHENRNATKFWIKWLRRSLTKTKLTSTLMHIYKYKCVLGDFMFVLMDSCLRPCLWCCNAARQDSDLYGAGRPKRLPGLRVIRMCFNCRVSCQTGACMFPPITGLSLSRQARGEYQRYPVPDQNVLSTRICGRHTGNGDFSLSRNNLM